jgi:hypothetical protein
MALFKCPECGQIISDQANACIHCGYPINKFEGNNQKEPELITVHVHRESRFFGCALTSLILVNGVQMGSVRSGGRCEFKIKPGLCNFTIRTGKQSFWEGGSEATTQYMVEPDKDLYIEFSSAWGIDIKTIGQK